ncbi:MAG: L-threonylcarbamoyladenylate synthase [Candidatus Woesearchaeota archaeon]
MNIISIKEALENNDIARNIIDGSIIIYPTDTIYGIGCNATNQESVSKIRMMKERYSKPLSIIVPNKEYIHNHFDTVGKEEHIGMLPGPYTLVMTMKERIVPINVTSSMKLGIRMISNEMQSLFTILGIPIITTSVNISGMPSIKTISELDNEQYNVFSNADIIVDGGLLDGNPSTVIDIIGNRPVYYRM